MNISQTHIIRQTHRHQPNTYTSDKHMNIR